MLSRTIKAIQTWKHMMLRLTLADSFIIHV